MAPLATTAPGRTVPPVALHVPPRGVHLGRAPRGVCTGCRSGAAGVVNPGIVKGEVTGHPDVLATLHCDALACFMMVTMVNRVKVMWSHGSMTLLAATVLDGVAGTALPRCPTAPSAKVGWEAGALDPPAPRGPHIPSLTPTPGGARVLAGLAGGAGAWRSCQD